jgi:hypothetical protein
MYSRHTSTPKKNYIQSHVFCIQNTYTRQLRCVSMDLRHLFNFALALRSWARSYIIFVVSMLCWVFLIIKNISHHGTKTTQGKNTPNNHFHTIHVRELFSQCACIWIIYEVL